MRRVYDLINAGDVDRLGDLFADNFVDHKTTPGFEPTKAGQTAFFKKFIAAFPDLRMAPEDLIASGDKVVARVRATGTHRGTFNDLSPTGKRIDVPIIDIIRFGDDGRALEHWGVFDQLGMLQQLGAFPAGRPA
jgi:steroid delta-isomerase-like uncharacterized protein